MLRPVFYQDPMSKEIAWLTDKNYNYQSDLVQKAYQLWKHQRSTYKFHNNNERWLDRWVGKDLSIIPHQVEIRGYLINLSRIAVHNNRHQHVQWMSFAKGIFSNLVLDLTIFQHKRRGLLGKITIHHGEGGICSNGVVERITS